MSYTIITSPSTLSILLHILPAKRMHDVILVAGTFDVLHDGHFSLFHTAFEHGKEVEIWVCKQ